MTNEDDDVLGIDLDAWQPPPPPANIADGVIARMRQEVTSVTVQALPVEPQPPKRRWWMLAVAAPLVAAAATALVVFGLSRPPDDASGRIAANRPLHLGIGPTSADVDDGTVVTWRRERFHITAQQAGGAATWRVDDDDTLTIETALGSIEATNASLRVEVKMLDEKKTIALSAVTAAAVAIVTIVVYEGAVKADGQTVAAGSAYQIKAKGENVIEEQMAVGGTRVDDSAVEIARLKAELAQKQAQLDEIGTNPFYGKPDDLSRAELVRVMGMLSVKACAKKYDGTIFATVQVAPDGAVTGVEMFPDNDAAKCVAKEIRATSFSATKQGTTFKYPFHFRTKVATKTVTKDYDFSANPFAASKPKCDVDTLLQKGRDAFGANLAAQALQHFEAAYACTKDPSTVRFIVASACKAKNFAKARSYWKLLNESSRDQLQSLCVQNAITREALEATPEANEPARLQVTNIVPAKVLLDGIEIGTTPLDMEVKPGRHKLTLLVGNDKHTFTFTAAAGAAVTFSKDIQ
jgi:hypothetical protein